MKKILVIVGLLFSMILHVSYAAPTEGYGSPEKSANTPQNQKANFELFSDKTKINILESGMDDDYNFSTVKKIMIFTPYVSEIKELQDTALQTALMNTCLKCAKVLKREILHQDKESTSADIYILSQIVQYQGMSENKDMPTQVRVKFAAYDSQTDKQIIYLDLSCEKSAKNSEKKAFETICKYFFKKLKDLTYKKD